MQDVVVSPSPETVVMIPLQLSLTDAQRLRNHFQFRSENLKNVANGLKGKHTRYVKLRSSQAASIWSEYEDTVRLSNLFASLAAEFDLRISKYTGSVTQ